MAIEPSVRNIPYPALSKNYGRGCPTCGDNDLGSEGLTDFRFLFRFLELVLHTDGTAFFNEDLEHAGSIDQCRALLDGLLDVVSGSPSCLGGVAGSALGLIDQHLALYPVVSQRRRAFSQSYGVRPQELIGQYRQRQFPFHVVELSREIDSQRQKGFQWRRNGRSKIDRSRASRREGPPHKDVVAH